MYVVYNPYVVAFIATIGGMLFGFDISSVSGLIGQDPYLNYFHHPNSITQGGITASMAGGSFLGSLAAGYISDRLGRKPTITISSVIWMIGSAIQCSAQNQGQLIAGRLIAGLAIGLASTQVPVWVAELSPANIRGRLVGMFQWAVTWGILIMFLITYGCTKIQSEASFRLAWGIQMIPGLCLGLGTLILPESPRWLANKDRWEEAILIIANVQGNGDINDPQVLVEVEEIKEQVRIDRESANVTFFELFNKQNINRTMVGVWAQIWQQLCGMNVMMYYIVYIFTMAGFQGDTNLIPSLIQYILNVAMTVPALLFIDRWGRRWTLLVGAVLMMTWLWAVAGLLAVYGEPVPEVGGNANIRISIPKSAKGASRAVIACSYLFVCSFAPTWGPSIWLYVSEIFPLRQRAKASGLCGSMNWIFNFALAMFVPSAFTNITWKTYCVFGTFCVAMFIHVFLLFPETKNKTLEEIEQIWEAKIPAWRTASFVPRQPSISDIKAVNGGRAPSFDGKAVVEKHAEDADDESTTSAPQV